jgi:hypothetical protein
MTNVDLFQDGRSTFGKRTLSMASSYSPPGA